MPIGITMSWKIWMKKLKLIDYVTSMLCNKFWMFVKALHYKMLGQEIKMYTYVDLFTT